MKLEKLILPLAYEVDAAINWGGRCGVMAP